MPSPRNLKAFARQMNQHLFALMTLSSAFGAVFGGLTLLARLVWSGDGHVIRNIRTAARSSGWPWWISHVYHRIFLVFALAAGVALLPPVAMLVLVLTGLLAIEAIEGFIRLYVGYLVITAVLGTAETVVMVFWAWPKFLGTRFDRDVPGAFGVRRMGRSMKQRHEETP